jgi:hypothetical protein
MTREELKEHCLNQIEMCKTWAIGKGEEPSGKIYEEHKLILELLEQEPKKGHWIMTSDYLTTAYGSVDYVKCSCCGKDSLEEGNYCPNCGVEMESEVRE